MGKGFWMNNIPMTKEEKEAVDRLHKAGCKCELPLLGGSIGKIARCRRRPYL